MTHRKVWAAAGMLALTLALAPSPASAQFSSSIEGTVTDSSGAILPARDRHHPQRGDGSHAERADHRSRILPVSGPSRGPVHGQVHTRPIPDERAGAPAGRRGRDEDAEPTLADRVGRRGGVVRAEVPLVETAQGRVSGLIEQTQVENLPLMGRNFFSLVVLTPGVIGRATGGGQAYAQSNSDLYNNEFGVNMNANGARTESNNFLIDSSTVSSSQRSGVVNINPNSESVQEVRVAVNNFSAEYGRNGSVLVNVITKSGSNALNGSLGTYYTNNTMQAKNYFQKQAAGFSHPDFGRTEFSWGAGGPIQARSDVLLHLGRRAPIGRRGERRAHDSHARVHPIHATGAPEQRVVLHRERISRLVRRPIATSARRGSTSARPAAAAEPIDSPIGPVPCNLPVTGEGTWNETSPRNGFQWTARMDHTIREGRIAFTAPSTGPPPTRSASAPRRYTRALRRPRRRAACTSTRTGRVSCRRRPSTRRRSRGCGPGANCSIRIRRSRACR